MKTTQIMIPKERLDHATQFFFNRVDQHSHPSGCWVWVGSIKSRNTKFPYGSLKLFGANLTAHRLAWTLLRGPIPENYVIDHLCRNTLCVNPEHLEPVTHFENCARTAPFRRATIAKNREYACKNGHPWTEETTIKIPGLSNKCKICRLDIQYRHRRKLGCKVKGKWTDTSCPNGHSLEFRIERADRAWCKKCRRESAARRKVFKKEHRIQEDPLEL